MSKVLAPDERFRSKHLDHPAVEVLLVLPVVSLLRMFHLSVAVRGTTIGPGGWVGRFFCSPTEACGA